MRFLVDAQLPPALAIWIARHGHEAEHVAELGLTSASDEAIWRFAIDAGAIIVTKDEDFALRRVAHAEGPAVLWIRVGNTGTRALLALMHPLFEAVVAGFERGETLIEIV